MKRNSLSIFIRLLLYGIILFGSSQSVSAQSPALSIDLKMDSAKRDFRNYKIEMKFCEPGVKTNKGNWFGHDTSTIQFELLKASDIVCNKYLENGEGIEELSGKSTFQKLNSFKYSNQVFAWEKILVFKITNYSSRAWFPEMYIVLPIRYKSFVTKITLTDIVFESGTVIYLDGKKAEQVQGALQISYSCKDEKTIEVKEFSLREIVE